MSGPANRLWAVSIKDKTRKGRKSDFVHLWVLAADSETASRKTKRWLRQNRYVGWFIDSVETQGTIDVF